MRNHDFDFFETAIFNGEPCYLVTKEVLDSYVYLKEASRRKENSTKLISKKEVLETLCCSESTLYRRLKSAGCKIKRGKVNGTFLKSSVIEELNN